MDNMTVAIIHKNRNAHLKECLNALMSQTIKLPNILVAWSGKKPEYMDQYPNVQFHQFPCSSYPDTRSYKRNYAVSLAKTKYVTNMESDIILKPETFQIAKKVLKRSDRQLICILRQEFMHRETTGILGGTFMCMTKEGFNKCGGFNPFLTGWGFEDYDFGLRYAYMNYAKVRLIQSAPAQHQPHEILDDVKNEKRNQQIASESEFKDGVWKYKDKSIKATWIN